MLPVIWSVLGVTIVVAAVRAGRSARALRLGKSAVAVLFIGAGALVNTVFLARGDDYDAFADGAYIPFVRETWRSLVVPNHQWFIALLIAFELLVGVLVLLDGCKAQIGLLAAIGFHIGLLAFGWGFYVWAVPMIAALAQLLRAERRRAVPRLTEGPIAPTRARAS